MSDARAPLFDPLQAAFAGAQELYKAGLLANVNTRRFLRGRAPMTWPAVGTTPKHEVQRDGAATLYRYDAVASNSNDASASKPALLLVCSLINRPYVLDLIEERSVVRRLLASGIDVWLLDWGTPQSGDARHGIAHYALEVLPRAVEAVRRETRDPRVHVLGYCMGGTFSLVATGAGAVEPASLVLLATPVDLHDSGLLSSWCRAPGLDAAEMARVHGNIPPYVLQPAFKMLDPVGMATKLAHLEPKLEDDDFVRFFLAMETWLEDSIAFPGRAFAEWVAMYRDNALVRGTLEYGGRPVDLLSLRCPILSVVAEEDYICPPTSSLAVRALAGSPEQELIVQPGGHIGLSTGKAAHAKLWPRVAEWLKARDAALVQAHKNQSTGVTQAHKNDAAPVTRSHKNAAAPVTPPHKKRGARR